MKKKLLIIVGIILVTIIAVGLVTSYLDSARVRNGVEPKFTIKLVSDNGNKVTYWGLGYKVVRYPSVSPNEPYKNNRGVKYGNWFMKYELYDGEKYHFIGTIIETYDDTMLVKPEEGSKEIKSSDKISVNITKINDFFEIGNKVKITYDGHILESYPAQIYATKVELVK